MNTNLKYSTRISIRFSQKEKEKISKIASSNQQTVSDFIRECTLEALEPRISEVNRSLYFEMGKITEYMYINGIDNEMMKNFKKLVKKIRLELMGIKEIDNKEDS